MTHDPKREIYLNMKNHGITHRDIDNENSTLRNWFNYQYDQVEHLLLFGGVMIGFTLMLIMGF